MMIWRNGAWMCVRVNSMSCRIAWLFSLQTRGGRSKCFSSPQAIKASEVQFSSSSPWRLQEASEINSLTIIISASLHTVMLLMVKWWCSWCERCRCFETRRGYIDLRYHKCIVKLLLQKAWYAKAYTLISTWCMIPVTCLYKQMEGSTQGSPALWPCFPLPCVWQRKCWLTSFRGYFLATMTHIQCTAITVSDPDCDTQSRLCHLSPLQVPVISVAHQSCVSWSLKVCGSSSIFVTLQQGRSCHPRLEEFLQHIRCSVWVLKQGIWTTVHVRCPQAQMPAAFVFNPKSS